MSFRRRNYAEVMDNVLTTVVGGVSAETHPFPPGDQEEPPYTHALERAPAADIIAVYGVRNAGSYAFVKDTDFALSADGNQLQWLEGGQLPDKGTVFQLNYMPKSTSGAARDIHVGSVLRTVAETIGLEIARLYAQLEAVYKSAYIDTASGMALDNVVALLGVQRVKAGRFSGEVVFSRTPGSRGAIYIPAGTRVMTADGNVEYETTAELTVLDGQNTARVIARDVEDNTQGVAADELTVLAKPITGIVNVTNPAPTGTTNSDESDQELRTRAKNFLHGSERATVGAIKEAVTKQGILADIDELQDGGEKTGHVKVIPHVNELPPELAQRINTAIFDSRPAGVNVYLDESIKAPTKVDLTLRLVTASDLLEQDLRAVQATVKEKIAAYFANLPIKEPGSVNKVIGLVLGIAEVQDMQIVQAKADGVDIPEADLAKGQLGVAGQTTQLGDLEIIDPNLPTLLRLVITHPEAAAPPNLPDINNALNAMLTTLNSMNEAEVSEADQDKQVLSFGKLLYVLPLPVAVKPQGDIQDVWLGPIPSGLAPTDIVPYQVQFVFTMESGISQTLVSDTDAYQLTEYERLSLAAVEVSAQP